MSREDVGRLAARLAAVSRAGLPAARAWQVLGRTRGPEAGIAAAVAAGLATGTPAAAAVRSAATRTSGPGRDALEWLAVTSDVVERSGAPAAAVLDSVVAGITAELDRAADLDVALAGPAATTAVLSLLPVAGAALGMVLGVNTLAVLLGSPAGVACLVAGLAFWAAGRAWMRRLVARACAG